MPVASKITLKKLNAMKTLFIQDCNSQNEQHFDQSMIFLTVILPVCFFLVFTVVVVLSLADFLSFVG